MFTYFNKRETLKKLITLDPKRIVSYVYTYIYINLDHEFRFILTSRAMVRFDLKPRITSIIRLQLERWGCDESDLLRDYETTLACHSSCTCVRSRISTRIAASAAAATTQMQIYCYSITRFGLPSGR